MASTNNRRGRLAAGAVIAILIVAGAVLLFLRSRESRPAESFTGYVVSDDIYMTSPVAGTLASVAVRRGQRVAAGDRLFAVDPTVRAAATDQARAAIAADRAQRAQQEAGLDRARADLAAAQADVTRYEAQARRLSAAERDKPGSVAALEVEQARAALEGALRRRDAARTQIDTASAGLAAVAAQVRRSEAGLVAAGRELTDLAPVAPVPGRVEDVMFKPGESVPANTPVVAIVPDGEVKIRFYVPQALVAAYRPGRRVAIACDGCAGGLTAVVDFVASEPEFTPPVIYSLDARQKLVFLVEAVPSKPDAVLPGQPIDVAPDAASLPRR